MSGNAKWICFCLCFLSVMAALGVWYVERKISQVNQMVDNTVTRVQDAVYQPVEQVGGVLQQLDAAAYDTLKPLAEAIKETGFTDAFESLFE